MDDGTTRGQFLKRFAVGAGGIAIASAVMAPAALSATQRRSEEGDIEILQYALTLEYLEKAFYQEALRKDMLRGETKYFAQVVAKHESEHVDALIATIKKLGKKPVSKPKFDFQGTTGKESTFQKTALALEETGVAAYIGQAPYVLNEDVLLAAARIATVEARHAAWMRSILGFLPAPKTFDGRRGKPATLRVVASTGFIVS